MSATEHGTGGLPDPAPTISKEYVLGIGETEIQEWRGTVDAVDAQYAALVALAKGGSNIAQVGLTKAEGRGRVIARYGRQGGEITGYSADINIVEELYAVDLIKDIWNAPLFNSGGTYNMSDNEASWVRYCVEERYSEADITANADASWMQWASWTDGMKELRYQMIHGNESYYETSFVFRRNLYGVRTSAMGLSFTDINRVVSAPSPITSISSIIASLPDGEWLYKPPQVESLGRGRVRGMLEWHWAEKWSVVYGGTFKLI